MSRKRVFAGLLAVVVLQLGVLAGEYLGAVYPLWSGREVRLRTVPVDPRSLFRGNYARLNYEISRIHRADFMGGQALRAGEVVYVRLREGEDGIFVADGYALTRPDGGLFIRGRVVHRVSEHSPSIRVRYGIEAYFAPTEKALDLERDLRDGGIAVVMIADSGKPALKGVVGTR